MARLEKTNTKMKMSEKKKQLVIELAELHKVLNVQQMYREPDHKTTKDWLAEAAAILKQLDESDYQEIIRLTKTTNPTVFTPDRKAAAHEIDTFVRRKVSEWKRYDFESLDNESVPQLMMGEAGLPGQPGSGGSIFIHAENFNMSGSGRISADGGDYVVHKNEINNLGTINVEVSEVVNNLTKLTKLVSESDLNAEEKRQLIGDIETVKAQAIKPTPDKTILARAWQAAEVASSIAGTAQLIGMIGSFVHQLLS